MKKHILLIEKNRDGYLDFMKVLETAEADCKVTYTKNYDHALKMLEYLVPDCIFMRIDGSEDTAIDCVKKIRERQTLNASTIVLYDDEVTGDIIRRSIMQGADYCIDRPCTYADISYLLKDLSTYRRNHQDRSFEY